MLGVAVILCAVLKLTVALVGDTAALGAAFTVMALVAVQPALFL